MDRREWWLVAVSVAAFLIVCILLIRQGAPFGHDEAVYASRAREFVEKRPASSWFASYRAPGLPILLTVTWLGKATEPYLRMMVVLSGVVLILSTWALGRLIVGRSAALVAAFGLALTPVVLMSSTQVWPDVPGAAAGMLTLALFAHGLSAPRFRWWVVLGVVVLIGITTSLRFGAPIPVGIGLVGLTLWRWPENRERTIRVLATAIGGAGVVALILLTTLVTNETAPLAAISAFAEGKPPTNGLADYGRAFWHLTSGAALVGLAGIAIGLVISVTQLQLRRSFLWPFGIACLTFVALALTLHGESRYLAPVYPWFWLAAGAGLAYLGRRLPRSLRLAVSLVLVLGSLALAPMLSDEQNKFNLGFATIKTAARSLDSGKECGVFTSYTPQVEWYSGCETVGIALDEVRVDSSALPSGPRYLLLSEKGKRQPEGEILEGYMAETTGERRHFPPAGQAIRYVDIWEIAGGQ